MSSFWPTVGASSFAGLLLAVAVSASTVGAVGAQARPTEARIHLSELARRIRTTNLARFGELVGAETEAAVRAPRGAQVRARIGFDRRLARRYGQYLDRRTAHRVRRFPWTEPLREGHPYLAGPSRPDHGSAHVLGVDYWASSAVNVAAGYADEQGYLDLERLRPSAESSGLARALWWAVTEGHRADAAIMDPRPRWAELLQFATQPTARKLLAEERARLIPRDMHALRWVREAFDPASALSGLRVFAHQHIVGNTVGMLEAMGLDPRRTNVWGKSYSTDPRAAWELRLRGFDVGGELDEGALADATRRLAAELARLDPVRTRTPQVLILDDGGKLLVAAAELVRTRFPRHAHLVVGVEQTTRGLTRLDAVELPFLVVRSAASHAKTAWGSPMFGYAIARQADAESRMRRGLFPSEFERNATVVGFGGIGAQVARFLRARGYRVTVHDTDRLKIDAARRAGFTAEPDRAAALREVGLLVTCVGGRVNSAERLVHEVPQHTIVVNGASDDEITDGGRPMYVREGGPDLGLPVLNTMQRVIDGRTVLFARSGGVANFPEPRWGDGPEANAVPGRYIQLELGLLYLSALQAVARGPAALDRARQDALIERVGRQLAERGESLADPRW